MNTDRIEVDIKVPNQTRYLCLIGHIGENIALALKHFGGDREKLAYELNLVLTEAMANAIQHANDKKLTIGGKPLDTLKAGEVFGETALFTE